MKDSKLSKSISSLRKSFLKYSLTIFIVALVSGLSAAVLILSTTLQNASEGSIQDIPTSAYSFDQATIDRVDQLKTSNETPGKYSPPSGRINPFSE